MLKNKSNVRDSNDIKPVTTMSHGQYQRMLEKELKIMKKEKEWKRKKSRSVSTVSGGLPSLGKKR